MAFEEAFDMYSAAYLGAYDSVKSLIPCCALDKRNMEGWTPLMYATSGQHLSVIELLLKSGARANFPGATGLTPVMIASRNGAVHVLDIFMQHMKCEEISLDARDTNGWTALLHAMLMGQEQTIIYLLNKGANANVVDVNKNIKAMATNIRGMNGCGVFEICVEAGVSNLSLQREATFNAEKIDLLPDLHSLFTSLGIEKYWKTFDVHRIGIKEFLMLNETDMKTLGVKLLGPRKKMMLAISQLRSKFQRF